MTEPVADGDAAVGLPASAASPRPEPVPGPLEGGPSGWVTVVDARGHRASSERPLRMRRVFAQVTAAAVVVLVLVAVGGAIASRRVAEREAVHSAAQTADLLAESAVEPALSDAVLTGDAAALARVDAAVRSGVLGQDVVRVKLWTPAGTILYSDEPRIVGATFALGADERAVLSTPTTHAEVSDLARPENRYERGNGPLLEVYRPVWTPSGQPLLFETYFSYGTVTARAGQLWRGFAGITLTSMLLLIALLLPVLWRLLDRVNAAQEQRVQLLTRAVDASDDERRRIAAALHDGVVQELAATSFAVSGAAERAALDGRPELAGQLQDAASTVRGSIGGLRSLLVDIYPPSLRTAGLAAALTDLAGTFRSRDVDVRLDLPAGPSGLDADGEQLVFRVAQECLRNAAGHSRGARVDLTLTREAATDTVLTVSDDGVGFDVAAVLADPPEGHLGLRVMGDLVSSHGALLQVRSGPGRGTTWRLVVATP